ncbi:MAG: hypothetical protein ABEJ76_07880 [Halanaeroarchaeum sp.]
MTEGDLSRRTLLTTLGASAIGATAFTSRTAGSLSDRETVDALLRAGSVDLNVGYETARTVDGETTVVRANPPGDDGMLRPPYDEPCETLPDGGELPSPLIEAGDLRPGDRGSALFDVHVCGNDAYVWVTGALTENAENGYGLGESAETDPDPDAGELASTLQARLWYDLDCDRAFEEGEPVIAEGSLETVLQAIDGGHRLLADPERACTPLEKIEFDAEGPSEGYEQTATVDGESVTIRLGDFVTKDDDPNEVVQFDFEVVEPDDIGVCRVAVKAGNRGLAKGNNEETDVVTFEDCARSGTIQSVPKTTGKGGEEYLAFSWVRFSVCGDPGGCFVACTDHCIGFEWWLPADVPNVRTDSAVFDLAYYAEQCRHNGGEGP